MVNDHAIQEVIKASPIRRESEFLPFFTHLILTETTRLMEAMGMSP